MKAASGCHVTGLALRVPYGVSFPYFGAGRGIILKIMRSPSWGGVGTEGKVRIGDLSLAFVSLLVFVCVCAYLCVRVMCDCV